MKTNLYRKLTAALCALVLLLGLSACGGSGQKPSDFQPDPAKVLQDEEGAPVGARQPGQTDDTEEIPTLTLGQLVQADGLHIVYEFIGSSIAKDGTPTSMYVFEDGELSVLESRPMTFGEMSRMTDREIADAVYADPKVVRNSPCFAYIRTDSSGNYVESEYLSYCRQYIGSLLTRTIKPGQYIGVREIYESKYNGYYDGKEYSYFLRGEALAMDTLDSEYVVVDPASKTEYLPTAAASLLYDGTVVPAPEDGSLFVVQPLSGGRTLGAEDVQYTQAYTDMLGLVLDVGPFAAEDWFISERAFDAIVILSDDYPNLWPGGYALYQAGANLYFRANPTAETLPLEQTIPVAIRYDAGGSPISIPAGTIESGQDLWTLYGEPHGALVQWNERLSNVTNYYYWKGSRDGVDFFLLYEDDGRDYPMWRYVQVCDTGLSIFEGDLRDELVTERALIELAR